MKSYSQVTAEVDGIIDRIREQYHAPDLDGVTIDALFVYDMEGSEPVLKHGGYPAQATVGITPIKDRALGMADAVIVIDRSNWLTLTSKQRDALIDHELYHLDRVVEADTEVPENDAVDRPKLKIRKHDHQVGIFSEILRRHGKDSAEQRMVQAIFDDAGQGYWNFDVPALPPAPTQTPLRVVSGRGAH